MLFSGGACSRRASLFKAALFSAKMRKAREREKELGVGRERENFVVVVVLFQFGMPCWHGANSTPPQTVPSTPKLSISGICSTSIIHVLHR